MANTSFSINDIINKQVQDNNLPIENPMDNQAENDAPKADENVQLVRFNKGDKAKDKDGNYYSKESRAFPLPFEQRAPSIPIEAKEGEPSEGYEWAQDAAQMIWEKGISMDEAEKAMNSKYKLADAIIKDNKAAALDAGNPESENYDKYVQYYEPMENYYKTDTVDGKKYLYYKDPRQQTEATLAKRYGLLFDNDPYKDKDSPTNPSTAIGLLNKANLKEDWKDWLDDRSTGIDYIRKYLIISSKLYDLQKFRTSKELKKLGFDSQEDYNSAVSYLIASLHEKNKEHTAAVRSATKAEDAVEAKKDQEELERQERVANLNKEPEEPTIEPTIEPSSNTETVADNTETNTETNEQPGDNVSFTIEQAKLNKEIKSQEEQAFKEAEEIAERKLTREESEEEERAIEEAARKARQDQLDYEEWLKNPSIISGIFGKSGLSEARRFGLGLSALFAIFSDVAASYGKGIRGNTDFKTEAMDALNSSIKAIQEKRANAIGDMSAASYKVAEGNDTALYKDARKMKNLTVGQLIPDDNTLQTFIQEAQVNPSEELSKDFYNSITAENRKGYIDIIKNNKKLADAQLDENGNLNGYGELQFQKKNRKAIEEFRNILGISDERLGNINKLLDLDKKKAEVKSAVHDVNFRTTTDYINAISALREENRTLENSKLELTEAKTLDEMLELAKKQRDVYAGLATSTSSSTEGSTITKQSVERFTKDNSFRTTNEELKKHGWQAEVNGNAGAGFPLKIVPIEIGISGGSGWTKEQANSILKSAYESWSKDNQRQLTNARNLSNASGRNIDDYASMIIKFLETEKTKKAEADFNKARENAIRAIDEKIEYNNQAIEEIRARQESENKKYDTDRNNSTDNPLYSMYNDVPTKNSNWYRHQLALS